MFAQESVSLTDKTYVNIIRTGLVPIRNPIYSCTLAPDQVFTRIAIHNQNRTRNPPSDVSPNPNLSLIITLIPNHIPDTRYLIPGHDLSQNIVKFVVDFYLQGEV